MASVLLCNRRLGRLLLELVCCPSLLGRSLWPAESVERRSYAPVRAGRVRRQLELSERSAHLVHRRLRRRVHVNGGATGPGTGGATVAEKLQALRVP